MAQFYSHVSAGQIADALCYDEEEMGEVIALIARHIEKMDSDEAEDFRDYIRAHGEPGNLRVLASHLVQVANEMEA